MDRRNRKYYLVKTPTIGHNECIEELKGIRTVKIHNPYDFDKNTNWGYANCLIGFSAEVEEAVMTELNSKWDYDYKAKNKEITKEMIGH